ncbi:MAG: hypothetical protein LUD81_01310 [Clostridiales bacterium]|nr:hypothetical protein [Clostridiales bacterium]
MKKYCNRENIVLAALLLALIVLIAVQIAAGKKGTAVFTPLEKEEAESGASLEDISGTEEIPEDEPDIYNLSGYIFKNSKSYMERLKAEVNNMANATGDSENLYSVAESIRLNQISYYTMLSQRYDNDNTELIEVCKSYVFNVEALAANIMEFINQGRTRYISRAMICISSDTALSNRFNAAAAAYSAALSKESEAETESETAKP